jgi:cytochrome c oxidase cbb3-type subunit I
MNERPLRTEPANAGEAGGGTANAPLTPAEIDASCRWPLLLLFGSALFWLVLSGVFAVISAIKLHAPGFLADCPYLTFGRVRPAQMNMLMYGFATQAAIGVAFWLMCRLGRTALALPGLAFVSAVFWNVGMTLGIGGILVGDSTGLAGLEIPPYASPMLLLSYLGVGACALLTFHNRRERPLYVSQWFLFAALFWFAWIYSVAQLLLVFWPERGGAQIAINLWFNHAVIALWLAPMGIGTIYYFLPKILGRPLHSRSLALFGFWCLALFAGWGGVHVGAPVPRWLNAMSSFAAMLMLIPLLAFALNCHWTIAVDCEGAIKERQLRFVLFATACYLLAGLLNFVNAFPLINSTLSFTYFTTGLAQLNLYGFFAAAMFGAMYYIIPRLFECEWPWPKLINVHYWSTVAGVVLTVLPLVIGGIVQGLAMKNPDVPFLDVVKRTIPFIGTSTLGFLILLIGNAAMLLNVGKLLWQFVRDCCWQRKSSEAEAKIKTAEVTA